MGGSRNWFGFVVATLLATVGAVATIRGSYHEILLATAGQSATAVVVETNYDAKTDDAVVRLLPPAPEVIAPLLAKKGHPPVGRQVDVRYLPDRPAIVRQDGATSFWPLFPGLVALIMGGVAADAFIHLRRRRTKRGLAVDIGGSRDDVHG